MTLEELKIAYEDLGKKIVEFEEQGTERIKIGTDYWFINTRGEISTDYWDGCEYDGLLLECGNIFLSELDAQRELARRKLEAKLIKMGGRKKFNPGVDNFSVFFDTSKKILYCDYWNTVEGVSAIYFDTEKQCQQAIDTYEDEILFVMGVTDSI